MHIPRNKIHKGRNKKILKIKNTINIRQNDNGKLNITNMPNIQRTKSLWYIQNTKWTKRHRKPTIKTNQKNTKHHSRKQHKQNNNTPLILWNTKNKQCSRTILQKLFTKIKEKQKKNHWRRTNNTINRNDEKI